MQQVIKQVSDNPWKYLVIFGSTIYATNKIYTFVQAKYQGLIKIYNENINLKKQLKTMKKKNQNKKNPISDQSISKASQSDNDNNILNNVLVQNEKSQLSQKNNKKQKINSIVDDETINQQKQICKTNSNSQINQQNLVQQPTHQKDNYDNTEIISSSSNLNLRPNQIQSVKQVQENINKKSEKIFEEKKLEEIQNNKNYTEQNDSNQDEVLKLLKAFSTLQSQQNDDDQLKKYENQNQIYKICITGGPCAGKTTGLTYLQEKMQELGFQVYVVPETATLLYQGGVNLDLKHYSKVQALQIQYNILKTQINLENTFHRIAKYCNNMKCVIFCDRGTMDGSAYIPPELWEELLTKYNLSELDLRDARYDAVIHLVTAANGAEQFFNQNNKARYENLEEAVKIDQLLQQAWLGHSNLEIIPNLGQSFEEKLENLLQLVTQYCGLRTSITSCYQRFLIDTQQDLIPKIPQNCKQIDFMIEDVFISFDKDPKTDSGSYTKVRKRGLVDQNIYIWKTVKLEQGKNILTLRKLLSEKDYNNILNKRDINRYALQKKRKCFIWDNTSYIIDTYLNIKNGFSLLKVPIKQLGEKSAVPDFIRTTRDITDEVAYKSYVLSKKNWYIPKVDEESLLNRKDSI